MLAHCTKESYLPFIISTRPSFATETNMTRPWPHRLIALSGEFIAMAAHKDSLTEHIKKVNVVQNKFTILRCKNVQSQACDFKYCKILQSRNLNDKICYGQIYLSIYLSITVSLFFSFVVNFIYIYIYIYIYIISFSKLSSFQIINLTHVLYLFHVLSIRVSWPLSVKKHHQLAIQSSRNL